MKWKRLCLNAFRKLAFHHLWSVNSTSNTSLFCSLRKQKYKTKTKNRVGVREKEQRTRIFPLASFLTFPPQHVQAFYTYTAHSCLSWSCHPFPYTFKSCWWGQVELQLCYQILTRLYPIGLIRSNTISRAKNSNRLCEILPFKQSWTCMKSTSKYLWNKRELKF